VDEALDREGMVETMDSGTSLTMNAVVLGAGSDPSLELGWDVHFTSSSLT
jgi:hypothetical protein